MLHIWNSNQELNKLTRKGYTNVISSYPVKRYLQVDAMDSNSSSCSPSKRAKFAHTDVATSPRLQDATSGTQKIPPTNKQRRTLFLRQETQTSGNSSKDDIDQRKLFTFSQIVMICEQKLRKQQEKLAEEYERALKEKLAEQYDTFIKFRRDQIECSLTRVRSDAVAASCSYLS